MMGVTGDAPAEAVKILIVEDSDDDARLLLHELRRAGFQPAGNNANHHESFA